MGIDWNEISSKSNGGTEVQCRLLEKYVEKDILDKYQIIPSRIRNPLDETRHRIFYAHDLPNDPESNFLADGGWEKFHRLAFVSHWQMNAYVANYNIPWSKVAVLQNAIEPIEASLEDKPTDKIHLVYHTTPHRGLHILVPVFEKLQEMFKDKIHLHVFSSFMLYGWAERDKPYETLFERIRKNEGMTYYGTMPNEEVRKQLAKSHIFAYPSVWPETSCICLMEAMSAACMCVHPNFGALPETGANWSFMYQFNEDQSAHAKTFFAMLVDAINYALSDEYRKDVRVQQQKRYADIFYSWELRKIQWVNFLASMAGEPTEFKKVPDFVYSTG